MYCPGTTGFAILMVLAVVISLFETVTIRLGTYFYSPINDLFSLVWAHIVVLRPPFAIATSSCYTQAISKIPNLVPGQITDIFICHNLASCKSRWFLVSHIGHWQGRYGTCTDVCYFDIAIMQSIFPRKHLVLLGMFL